MNVLENIALVLAVAVFTAFFSFLFLCYTVLAVSFVVVTGIAKLIRSNIS